ncbi:MAG: vWA domain-containing protein [Lachnospiraceae bacterium]
MKHKRIITTILTMFVLSIFTCVQTLAEDQSNREGAVIFVLDVSGSMQEKDSSLYVKDAVEQMIDSLPSNYQVGVVTFNSGIVEEHGFVPGDQRYRIRNIIENVNYAGYSNVGVGIERATKLLEQTQDMNKYMILLTDGEVLMDGDGPTQEALNLYQSTLSNIEKQDITFYEVDLDHPLQQSVDYILENVLNVKQSTVALVDADGNMENISLDLPFSQADKIRIVLTCDAAIKNLVTDFQAESAGQMNGERYSFIEINKPSSGKINIKFVGTSGSQVRVNVIPEYHVSPDVRITYEDDFPKEEDAKYYERTAQINYFFVDADNRDIRLWTEDYFNHNKIPFSVNGVLQEGTLNDGVLDISRIVNEKCTVNVRFDYSGMPVNVIGPDTIQIDLEEAPLLPVKEPEPPYVLIGVLTLVVLIIVLPVILYLRRPKKQSVVPEDKPEPGKYNYTGKLNLYITRTRSGYDIPPLSYNLFRLPAGKVLSLREVLEGCNVKENFEGAENIYFKSGTNRNLILTNNSDCTLMKSREILMKNKSYPLSIDSKVDITFEDEISEMTFQYKDLKPSEMH